MKEGEIKSDPKNARVHNKRNKELIKKSLEKLGAGRSIVMDNENFIIAGNGVFEQAQSLGIKHRVIETDGSELIIVKRNDLAFDDMRRKELAIVDNAATDASSFNYEVFEEDYFKEFDFEEWGIDGVDKKTEGDDGFNVSSKVQTNVKRKDLILFDNGTICHRLLCGDSSNVNEVKTLIGESVIKLLLTDPRYGVDYTGKTKDALKIQNDNMSEDDTRKLFDGAITNALPCMSKGASIYATVPAGPLHLLFTDVLNKHKCLRQILVWNKDSMVLGRSDYHYKHEPILYGWKPGAKHYFTPKRTQTSVIDIARPKASREHPTMKPVELWNKLIQNSSRKKVNVYDPFIGSGTTMVSCHQLHRSCFGMELSPQYCQIIINRMLALDPSIKVTVNGKPYK